MMVMDQLFGWDTLGTLAGAAGLTYLIVGYTKRVVDRIWPAVLGTDLYAVLVGSAILLAATAAQGRPLTWDAVLLAVFNGFVVAAASGKMHDKAVQEQQRRPDPDAGV